MKRPIAALLAAAMPVAAPAQQPAAPPISPAASGPQDADERGLWMQVDDVERRLRASNFVIRDDALNAYVRGVLCRTVGDAECAGVRIYITRTPYFNASMAPNGMMQIWSGLFLRVRDEAQLAAVLAHEYTHYRNRHSLLLFREVKRRTNAMAWLSVLPVGGLIAAGVIAGAQVGLAGSIFGFSRDMEREADAMSVTLLAQAGYDPAAAAAIWRQIRAEQDATAQARGRRRRGEGGMFATHPPTDERLATLSARAADTATPRGRTDGRAPYRAALAPYWVRFIDDQVKLNDFGATDLLLTELAAADRWTGELLYARGELYRARAQGDDFVAAADQYRRSIAEGGPAEAHRGLGLALLRAGDPAGGRAALNDYLRLKPDAGDRAMIAMMAGG